MGPTKSRSRLCTTLLAASLFAAGANAEELDERFDRDVLIVDAATACLRFDVYLAVTREQQIRGLMFVRELPSTTGMLFVYEGQRQRSMWMRNTYIPLDIAFARQDGSILNIARDTVPLSEESVSSTGPATYVLELNAGVTEALSIEPGSRLLLWPAPNGGDVSLAVEE